MDAQKLSRLNVRLSPEEHAAIARRASGAGLTVSEYIRRSALQDTDRPIIRTDAEKLQALYRNLRKAGEAEMLIAFRSISRASDELSAFIHAARNSI